MRLLIKLGGTLLDAPESRARLTSEIAAISAQHATVVVHGGGKQMTRYLAERGVESKFVDGLRVTSAEVLDAVLKVFAGTVNHELVAAFVKAGARSVGLTGIDARLTEARQMREDLGHVGVVIRADGTVLDVLSDAGFLPVVACVAGDREGNIYNVNADQMAVACAVAFRADRLLFLTDVDGVKGPQGLLSRLTPSECDRLIADGVATGGMQAKLTAACDGVAKGVGEVHIVPGGKARVVDAILSGMPVGTRLVREGK